MCIVLYDFEPVERFEMRSDMIVFTRCLITARAEELRMSCSRLVC